MKLRRKLLSPVHILLSKSRIITWLAAKIRNQCDLVIRQRFGANNMDPQQNGEYLVLETVLPHCSVFFDIGANKGEWTNFILENKKDNSLKCYLFEPGLTAFGYLQQRFKNNNTIELKNSAVSNVPGLLDFYEEENAGGMSSAVKGWANNPIKLIQVACTTVDEEIDSKKIAFLDFMKIDVEGFDLKVIEGACQSLADQKIGILQFEYNSGWLNTGSSLSIAYQILKTNGYEIYLIKHKGLFLYDIDTYGDFYTFSNFLAVSSKCHSLIKNLIRN